MINGMKVLCGYEKKEFLIGNRHVWICESEVVTVVEECEFLRKSRK